MAEKILQTRIQLKYDTFENWQASTFKLKAGEVAICTVPENNEDGVSITLPAVLMKVGDGQHTFAELPWLQAKAADVYAWAKAAKKPEYTATEIKNLEQYIGEKIQDTDTQYTLIKGADDYTWQLKSRAKGETEYGTLVATLTIPDKTAEINSLKELVGETAVATQITNAIGNLDVDEVTAGEGQIIGSIKEVDGKITATTRALVAKDIPTIEQAQVNGLGTALAAKQDTVVWQSANYDAETNKAITKSDLDAAVAGLSGAVHFVGVKEALPATGANGDICIVGNKEYVYSTSDKKWHELGDETIYAVKGEIVDAHIKADAAIAQSKIAGLTDALDAKLDATTAGTTYETKNDATAKLTEAKGYTDAEIQKLDVAQVTAVAGSMINTISQTDGKIAVTTREITANDIPVLTQDKITGLAAALNAKANDADLAAIAKTGNVNDLIQTAGDVLVFDCGSATKNI